MHANTSSAAHPHLESLVAELRHLQLALKIHLTEIAPWHLLLFYEK